MKRTIRIPGIFLCLILMISVFLPGTASAASASFIDITTASAGYVTVACTQDGGAKMKVGVTYGADTAYYDYVPGTVSSYALTKGNGAYTIALYRNTTGTSYQRLESAQVEVSMADALAPYRVSTSEVTFAQGDAVSQKAAQLCAGLTSDSAKAVAIHNYIASNFTYDYDFAAQVANGQVKNYIPNTNQILSSGKGICYDFAALYAAMCRSQGIPCAIAKGYLSGTYHAWNMVYVNGQWNAVDLTRSVCRGNTAAASLADCLTDLSAYTGMRY